ncbi:aminopeptidase [Fulvitalea axinellae]|uniref:Aminopeptidase N n=1 Tax=Fulvitalea axinellae TaxID=1182444 RepID=A0AAU9CFM7_9BACT|nr:aminopeptidase [Fulvitalea axinellae]
MIDRILKVGVLAFAGTALVSCSGSKQIASQAQESDAEVAEVSQVAPSDSVLEIYRASRPRTVDLLHTKLEVKPDWSKRFLYGVATLELSPYFYPQEEVELDAKGFDVSSVGLAENGTVKPLAFDYDGKKIWVKLDREYTRDEKLVLSIDYVAKPDELEVGGSDAISQDKGLYFIDPDGTDPVKPTQLWTQGETEASSCWFPTIDSPNERCTQEIYITVDDRFKTLSNGVMVFSRRNEDGTRTDYWKMDKAHAPYLFMMAVGEFAVVEEHKGGLEYKYYVEPEYEGDAKAIFGNTPEMVAFFSEKLDYPFPWPKYSQVIVRDFVSGAMENTSASVFMESVQSNKRELIDRNWDGIIAHELFHQWFGDLVTCESWSNLPLNEAFANYSEYLWNEHKYGKDAALEHQAEELAGYLEESKVKKENLIRYHYRDKEEMFDRHSYNKGGRVLHMLRDLVGDEAFFKSLSVYLKHNAYKSVELANLRLAFEEVTGMDLNWFFQQWFLRPGHPVVDIETSYDEANKKLIVELGQAQISEDTPAYTFPLDIELWSNGKKELTRIWVDSPSQRYEIPFGEKPENVVVDPESLLCGEIRYEQTPEAWLSQYKNGENVLVRGAALNGLVDIWGDSIKDSSVFITALNDPASSIREYALDMLSGADEASRASVLDKVAEMAEKDPSSMVRSAAIVFLGDEEPNRFSSLFRLAMADSSYSVVGSALYSYSMTDAQDCGQVMERFENEKNVNVVLSIAGYYAEKGKYDKFEWLMGKYASSQKQDRWYMVQLLGQLLMRAPEAEQRQGAEFFMDLAMNDKAPHVRLAAFQSVSMLGYEGISERLMEIRENEADPRLREIYASLAGE